MSRLTLVFGLSASGKSHYIKNLSVKTKDVIIGVGEDKDEGFSPFDTQNFRKLFTDATSLLLDGKNCIVSDISLCRRDVQEYIVEEIISVVPDVEIKWVCFKNNMVQANKNVIRRAKSGVKPDIQGHIAINEHYSKIYFIPEDAEVIDVFNTANGIKI